MLSASGGSRLNLAAHAACQARHAEVVVIVQRIGRKAVCATPHFHRPIGSHAIVFEVDKQVIAA